MVNKIIAWMVIGIMVLFGIRWSISSYGDLKEKTASQEHQITQLRDTIETNRKTYEANMTLIKEELLVSKRATTQAIINASKSDSDLNKVKRELNETSTRYNDLITNGYRLRDPYTRTAESGATNSGGGQGTNQKGDSTIASSSNAETGDNRLSEGFTRYLIDRSIKANEVVNQLFIVQEFAKKQHAWILDNCNAVEAKSTDN